MQLTKALVENESRLSGGQKAELEVLALAQGFVRAQDGTFRSISIMGSDGNFHSVHQE